MCPAPLLSLFSTLLLPHGKKGAVFSLIPLAPFTHQGSKGHFSPLSPYPPSPTRREGGGFSPHPPAPSPLWGEGGVAPHPPSPMLTRGAGRNHCSAPAPTTLPHAHRGIRGGRGATSPVSWDGEALRPRWVRKKGKPPETTVDDGGAVVIRQEAQRLICRSTHCTADRDGRSRTNVNIRVEARRPLTQGCTRQRTRQRLVCHQSSNSAI